MWQRSQAFLTVTVDGHADRAAIGVPVYDHDRDLVSAQAQRHASQPVIGACRAPGTAPLPEALASPHRPPHAPPQSRARVAAVHSPSGVDEERTEAEGAPPTHRHIESSARINVKFLREAGLEEALRKSRAEAEILLGTIAK